MTANQMYKNSGSTLTFREWLNREKEKGVVKVNLKLNCIIVKFYISIFDCLL